jgi:hypothetical protein
MDRLVGGDSALDGAERTDELDGRVALQRPRTVTSSKLSAVNRQWCRAACGRGSWFRNVRA